MIRIRFQLRAESAPRTVALKPENYFEPLGPGETYERDAIPRFDHAFQFTGHAAEELKWTVLEDGPTRGSLVRTQFLDGQRCMMTHRIDADGYEEMIHSTEFENGGFLVVRTVKMPGKAWSVVMSNYSVNNSLGVDNLVGWSFHDAKSFCGIGIRAELVGDVRDDDHPSKKD